LNDVLKPEEEYIIAYDQTTNSHTINTKHDYYHQIQSQIYFCQRDYGYLLLWTKIDHLLLKIPKDPEWEKNIAVLCNFYINEYVPHILNEND
jgi:hypothetical protein